MQKRGLIRSAEKYLSPCHIRIVDEFRNKSKKVGCWLLLLLAPAKRLLVTFFQWVELQVLLHMGPPGTSSYGATELSKPVIKSQVVPVIVYRQ